MGGFVNELGKEERLLERRKKTECVRGSGEVRARQQQHGVETPCSWYKTRLRGLRVDLS